MLKDRYKEDRENSSRLLLFVRKVNEDLFHIRMFDPDADYGDNDFLSDRYYYRDDEIEELIEDLCDGYSIDPLLGSAAGHSIEHHLDGNILDIIFEKEKVPLPDFVGYVV